MGRRWGAALPAALAIVATACAPGAVGRDAGAPGVGLEIPGFPEERIAAGLREALRVGTEKAVGAVARVDGYFGNPKVRIPIPPALQRLADTLRGMGLAREVEELILRMNRAAEQAAPQATPLILEAIATMTFEDARQVLEGQEDQATRYFEARTAPHLSVRFRPIVRDRMEWVGATRLYQDLLARYTALPLVRRPDLELDRYVTVKSLEGLFVLLEAEERRIRTDPAARVTTLLQEIFAR